MPMAADISVIMPDDPLIPAAAWAQTDEPLLWLIGSGHQIVTRGNGYFYDCRTRRDAHVGLQLTLAGEGFYERAGKVQALPVGCAFYDEIPGDFRYGYPRHAHAPYEQVWVDMYGEMAQRLWREVHERSGPVLDLGADNALGPLLLALNRDHKAGMLADRYLASARLYEVVMTVLAALGNARVTTAPLVQRAITAIHRHGFDPEWDVGTLAQHLDVSREHLARVFVAATGVAPKAYLLQFRLRHARELLRSSDAGLETIAARCGFSGANYFCRAFRERFSVTPGVYRAQPWRKRVE